MRWSRRTRSTSRVTSTAASSASVSVPTNQRTRRVRRLHGARRSRPRGGADTRPAARARRVDSLSRLRSRRHQPPRRRRPGRRRRRRHRRRRHRRPGSEAWSPAWRRGLRVARNTVDRPAARRRGSAARQGPAMRPAGAAAGPAACGPAAAAAVRSRRVRRVWRREPPRLRLRSALRPGSASRRHPGKQSRRWPPRDRLWTGHWSHPPNLSCGRQWSAGVVSPATAAARSAAEARRPGGSARRAQSARSPLAPVRVTRSPQRRRRERRSGAPPPRRARTARSNHSIRLRRNR